MHKFLVLTTINSPSKTIKDFTGFKDWNIVVVADNKTPPNWKYKNVTFLSVNDQNKMPFKISKILPWNSYARKNIGYLYAIKNGADFIAETDDDNFPLENWGWIPNANDCWLVKGNGFLNIYSFFAKEKIWPRGFPLNKINDTDSFSFTDNEEKIGVWQSLVNGDTDVDAVYRLTNNNRVSFEKKVMFETSQASAGNYSIQFEQPQKVFAKKGLVLDSGIVCPFNSQNTAFIRECFSLMYLPATVTMRSTDIFRGLIAQPVMWAAGLRLGFTPPNAYQERNIHDYLKDFEDEIPVYKHSGNIVELVKKAIDPHKTINENLLLSYKSLVKHNIVAATEINILKTWLQDLAESQLSRSNLKP